MFSGEAGPTLHANLENNGFCRGNGFLANYDAAISHYSMLVLSTILVTEIQRKFAYYMYMVYVYILGIV